jgi:CelD/BcsL family acetyltransferase involved in cellulose biosynthesis
MLEVVEINRLEELEPQRAVWQKLFAETPGASFFQTFDWTVAYLRRYGHSQSPRILFVYEDGRPIGIAPMTVTSERTRLGAFRVLTYPLADWGTFFGPIGPHTEKTLSAALSHIRSTPRNWDLLDLRWSPAEEQESGDKSQGSGARDQESKLRSQGSATASALAASGFPARQSVWKETAIVDFDGDWSEYLAGRTTRFRNNLRRAQRRTQALGAVEFIRYRPRGAEAGESDPRWDLYDACVELAERSWQGASSDGTTLSHESVRSFLRETHALASRLGMVDLNLLLVNGRPAAFGYNYHHRGAVFGLRAGYDGELTQSGVGVVLYGLMFQDSFARGDKLFDLGPGSLESKRRWITRTASSYRFTHYPLIAPRAQLLRVKHWLFNRPEIGSHSKGVEAAVGEN